MGFCTCIDNVNINFSTIYDANNPADQEYSPFVLKNGTVATVTLLSDSYFRGADEVRSTTGNYYIGYAGINVQTGTKLIISKDSLGRLTAEGGSATSYHSSSSYTNVNINARAGAGIGANGNPSESQYDDGCGEIVINGDTISAYGGYGLYE